MKTKKEIIPVESKKGKVQDPPKTAAGLPALSFSLNHIIKHMKPGDAVATMRKLNQKGGFDCPGCAWPDPDDDRSKLGEYCENGVKAIAEEASKRALSPSFFQSNSIEALNGMSSFELGKTGRIDQPYYKNKGDAFFQPISWKDAIEKISAKLQSLNNPNEAIFYTSGRTSNEAAFLFQLMVRKYGTNNLPDCSNMCHESSGVGLSATLGIGKGSVTLEDIHHAELIMVMGQNPGTNHPRMLSALEKCKENGGKIIAVNPLKETGLLNFKHPQKVGKMLSGGTKLTDLYLQLKINSDIYLLKAIMHLLLKWDKERGDIIDHNFINEKTSGWAALREELKKVDLGQCLKATGLSMKEIEEAANLIAKQKRIIICWAMGLTQHLNGAYNVQEIVNLLLMKGAIGKPGAGTCPVRGHSNVQGDRTMGIWHKPKQPFLNKLEQIFGFEPPTQHGFGVVEAIKALHERKSNFLFCMGGNLLTAAPDTTYAAEALQNTDMIVSVSTKLNKTHLVTEAEALILPCKGRTEQDNEQFVSVENSMGIVHKSEGVLPPLNDIIKSEVEIICELGDKLFEDEKIPWKRYAKDYDTIRDDIEEVIDGFQDYNKRVRNPAGFYLPNGARNQDFKTSDGKAHFTVNPYPDCLLAKGEFALMTMRSHDQFNTTIYGENDRYRGIKGMRRIALMNRKDMEVLDLKPLDMIDLTSHYNDEKRMALRFKVVAYEIPQGNIGTYFPEANCLVHIDAHDRISETPASKFVRVRVAKSLI